MALRFGNAGNMHVAGYSGNLLISMRANVSRAERESLAVRQKTIAEFTRKVGLTVHA